jgi:flagellar hook-associated protein 2
MASSTASVSGLASGLDTASIIDSLMTVEAAPQTRLKTNLTTEQTNLSSLQALNAKAAALVDQAKELAAGTGWNALTATSSSTAVALTTTGGTAAGSFTFTVNQTATAHRLTFSSTAAATDTVVSGGTTVKLTSGGVTQTLDTGNGSLDGLVRALNGAGTGVTATKVKLDDGSYRLVVNASKTGAAAAFTLTNADGSDVLGGATVTAGTDASITMGSDTIHSATNTFSGVVPGVDVTVSTAAVGTSVEVNVARDSSKVQDKVKSLVDNVNALLTQIDSLTTYDSASKTSGPLAGEPSLRTLRTNLLNAVYPPDNTSMASVGLQTDRNGKLVFDPAAFATAYAADPAAVADKFTSGTVDGFAARLAKVTSQASDKYTGTITSAITGHNSEIKELQDDISTWDTRLELRRSTLNSQFTALETAMNQMTSQSSWLAGQISSLSGSS